MSEILSSANVSATESHYNHQQKEICKKCNELIVEGHAYELGEDRWHINCFNCSKCQTSLGCNSNFLVLGNGNLICSNCSYNCKQCNRKIDDLAILTGDQAYCSSCFKCRNCKNKIEDLRYARTSKGLFCMDCHEKLVAKKKKYDAKKKHLEMLQQKQQQLEKEKDSREMQFIEQQKKGKSTNSSRNSLIQSYMNSNSSTSVYDHHQNNSSTSLQSKHKQLPKPPSSNESIEKTPKIIQSTDNDFSIEEVQNSSSDSDANENETIINGTTSLRKNKLSPTNQYSTPPLDQRNVNHDRTIQLDIVNTPSSAESISQNQLKPAPDLTPKNNEPEKETHEKETHEKETHEKGKNLLILSPNQYHDNEFHAAKSPVVNNNTYQYHDVPRSGASSPFAKANRQARVVETNDEIPTEVVDEDLNKQINTPKKQQISKVNLSSPPPKLPLPSTPTRKKFDESVQKGLGLQGIDYEPKQSPRTFNTTPSVTNLETTPQQEQQPLNQAIPVFRTASIIRGLKHKRSTSGGNNKFAFFKSKDEKGHSRHVSDSSTTSFNASNNSFITPPLNNGSTGTVFHTRSTSDSTMLFFEEDPYDLTKIKYEVQQLANQKMILDTDIHRLKSEKAKLTDNLKTIRSSITDESIKYDNLIKEIQDLNMQKQKLYQENKELIDLNNKLKETNLNKSTSNDTESSSVYRSSSPIKEEELQPQQIQIVTSLEDEQTHKATRLKFWRRPKIGTPQVVPIESSQVQVQPQQKQNNNLRVNQPQSNGNKFTKSVSTNILDSFLYTQDSNNLFNTSIQKRADYEGNSIPFLITRCILEVEKRGLDFEGIYRISGGNSTIVQIEQAFTNLPIEPNEKQINNLDEIILNCDIHAITSALKRYLRKLPEPLIPYSFYDDYIKIAHLQPQQRVSELNKLIVKLPVANQKVLQVLTKHLNKINSLNHINRMNFKNLSVVFAPTLARDQSGEKEMTDMGYRNDSTETLLTESINIFK
ncbi:unnamed protein product [Candida verbasci]|uniref:RhoGAP-domain-containing protein n=1 Tax=Candida verbasci TaxID=1227364 RepID=A0A9W4U093_9ASCO|nr:unnamed protein product [Candida verbasci]